MTNENMIKQLKRLIPSLQYADDVNAVKGAIKALSQEPCEDDRNNLCSSCTNIGCEFQSGIVRTKCAFYMPPHIETDNCGNYVVMQPVRPQEPCEDCISRQAVLDLVNADWKYEGLETDVANLPSVTPMHKHVEPTQKNNDNTLDALGDAISRDMALEKMADYVASGYADSAEDFEEYSRIICQLPSVTQKSGKWIAYEVQLPDRTILNYRCSVCGRKLIGYNTETLSEAPFCHCGARMVEPQESEE